MLNSDTPASVSIHYYNSHKIRAHIHAETNQVWLVGADVCKALNITNPSYVASKFDANNIKKHTLISAQGKQLVTWFSPLVIYELCTHNKATNGKQFFEWYKTIQTEYVSIPRDDLISLINAVDKIKHYLD